ncbi:exported hypothetical protein [metagenome]|uniref:Uncharacterized protein n=1 Tax=metagenome TaxID=256318 RepID=A0A2P2C0Y7_9ZZZZ
MKRWFIPMLVLIASALSPAAQAAPLEHERYSGTDSFDFDDCGFIVHEEVAFEGNFLLKAPRKDGAPPYLLDNYEVHETLTANGRTLTIDHQGLYKDLRITLVEGTVYQFVSMEAGQPFVMRDSDGEIMFRDRGVLKSTFQVDTQGDTDLDNDEFVEDSFVLLADHGRHPGFYIDFCSVLDTYFNG